jgi:hypothetical protein
MAELRFIHRLVLKRIPSRISFSNFVLVLVLVLLLETFFLWVWIFTGAAWRRGSRWRERLGLQMAGR